jgi:hypothetical protein
MKPRQILPRSSDAFHKWSDEHRAQMWGMIEKLGKGEVSYKEARNLLREEKKALSAVSKRLFGFRTTSLGLPGIPAHSTPRQAKARKTKRSSPATLSAPPLM